MMGTMPSQNEWDKRELARFEQDKEKGLVLTYSVVIEADRGEGGAKGGDGMNGDDFKLSPEQRLEVLEFAQAERKKITDNFPVKTYAGWQASGFRTFEDYCFPGDEVDNAMVEHFVNSVPPSVFRSDYIQAGEAYSLARDDDGKARTTYATFHRIAPDRWKFDGYCFYGESENRDSGPTRLERCIAEARKEAERSG